MKGLASTSLSFATVGVQGRCARKHYGIEVEGPFLERVHLKSRRLVQFLEIGTGTELIVDRYWSAFAADWCVPSMEWFIKKVINVLCATYL